MHVVQDKATGAGSRQGGCFCHSFWPLAGSAGQHEYVHPQEKSLRRKWSPRHRGSREKPLNLLRMQEHTRKHEQSLGTQQTF